MIQAIVLDTSPLGIATAGGKQPDGARCRQWIVDCTAAGVSVYLPEIADYELRRELIRTNSVGSIQRLDMLKAMLHYLPITTAHMLHAANLWANARNAGVATADKHALDGDVILCAQALGLGLAPGDIIVASGNVKHIGKTITPQMTPAQMMDYWEKEGILGPWGGDQDSVELARELRKRAETRDHSK